MRLPGSPITTSLKHCKCYGGEGCCKMDPHPAFWKSLLRVEAQKKKRKRKGKPITKKSYQSNKGEEAILCGFASFSSFLLYHFLLSKSGTRKRNFLSLSFRECQTVFLSQFFGNHCLCIEKSNSGTMNNFRWEGLPNLRGLRLFLLYCAF